MINLGVQDSEHQRIVSDVVRVVDAAADLVGDRQRAVEWVAFHPIADFHFLRPKDLIEQGKTQAVLDYIESLSAGASG